VRRSRFPRILFAGLLCHAGGVVATELTEKDYFSDLPEVTAVQDSRNHADGTLI
jgi:hypothetical protein